MRGTTLAAYGAPALFSAFAIAPVLNFVPALYAESFGLSLQSIGLALLLSRGIDVLVDPLVGYLSDRTTSRRGGRRKPWVIIGCVVLAFATYALFTPPGRAGLWYFTVFYGLVYLSWSSIEIPHAAWAYEIAVEGPERYRVLSVRTFAAQLGGLAFLLIATAPALGGVTLATIGWAGRAALVLGPLAALCAAFGAPAGDATRCSPPREALLATLSNLARSRPFRMFLSAFTLKGLADGMWAALSFLFISDILRLGAQVAIIFIVITGAILATLTVTPRLLRTLGKRRAWTISAVGVLGAFALVLLLPRGEAGLGPLLALCVVIGAGNAVAAVAPASVLGDVIDADREETGRDRAASYSGVYALVTKLNNVIGGSGALIVAGLLGYTPHYPTTQGAMGLVIAYMAIPTALSAASIYFIWRLPAERTDVSVKV